MQDSVRCVAIYNLQVLSKISQRRTLPNYQLPTVVNYQLYMPKNISYTIEHSPSYAQLKLKIPANQTVLVESSGMAAMDSHITLKSKIKGGLMKGLTRMFAGESLFISEFTSPERSGTLYVSPGVPGDIQHYHLDGNCLMLQSSAFVASSSTVDLDTKFQGLKGFFSGESLFFLKATGQGDIWFNSYGAILEIPVNGSYIVDTGYIVAFEDTLKYNVEVMGGLSWKNLRTGILGGEGLVCRFSGQGKLWIQSRNLFPLINFLNPFRPTKND
jgi:TIGR00266 family protein